MTCESFFNFEIPYEFMNEFILTDIESIYSDFNIQAVPFNSLSFPKSVYYRILNLCGEFRNSSDYFSRAETIRQFYCKKCWIMYKWDLYPEADDFKLAAFKNYFKAVYLAVDEFIDSCETHESPFYADYPLPYPQHTVISTAPIITTNTTSPVQADNYQSRFVTNVEYFF